MRKSKVDTAATRQRILAVASDIFLRQGLAATGIADIMVAAGLTQGGFYRHFKSKEQLIAEANASAFDDLFAMFDAATSGKSPDVALDTIVESYLCQLDAGDVVCLCPLANLGSELRHADEQVRAVAAEGYARLVKLISSHLMRMNVADNIRVAESIVITLVGAVSLSRLAVGHATTKAILGNARNTITSLVHSAALGNSGVERPRG